VLLALLLAHGCVSVEQPPGQWPGSGCSASAPAEGSASGERDEELWLEVEPELRLKIRARWPRGLDCHGAVVVLPPGFEGGERVIQGAQGDVLVDHGLAVLSLDPRGRGESDGEEDANGYAGQDDVAALLRWVASQEQVDPDAVVLSSRSFAGALAAGALGRHGDLQVRGWVDYESPGYLAEDLLYAPSSNQETFAGLSPEDPVEALAWWAEREPAQLVVGVQRPYHRFQGLPDHALGGRTAHAAAMLKAASQAPELRYNEVEVVSQEITAGYVRDNAIREGLDPESSGINRAILDLYE